METTFLFLKQHVPVAAMIVIAGLFFNSGLDERFERLDERFERLDERIERQGERIQGLSDEIQQLRFEMSEEFKAVRSEMAAGDQAIRAEMAAGFSLVQAQISDLGERMARVETRTDGIEERLDRDSE